MSIVHGVSHIADCLGPPPPALLGPGPHSRPAAPLGPGPPSRPAAPLGPGPPSRRLSSSSRRRISARSCRIWWLCIVISFCMATQSSSTTSWRFSITARRFRRLPNSLATSRKVKSARLVGSGSSGLSAGAWSRLTVNTSLARYFETYRRHKQTWRRRRAARQSSRPAGNSGRRGGGR